MVEEHQMMEGGVQKMNCAIRLEGGITLTLWDVWSEV